MDDWKKNLSVLKRELEGQETINIKKSDKVLFDLINKELIPFVRKTIKDLSEFEDLFLSYLYYYTPSNDANAFPITLETTEQNVQKYFQSNITFKFLYKEFRKNILNPFNIHLEFTFVFEEYKYQLVSKNEIMFSNLYHQRVTEQQFKETVSLCGMLILSEIKKHLQQA